MRSDTWLQDRKRQGLWVKWVLARVCRKPEANSHLCTSLACKEMRRSRNVSERGHAHMHTHSFHIFCGHLGLIKGKWRAPCSSFKDKTKCWKQRRITWRAVLLNALLLSALFTSSSDTALPLFHICDINHWVHTRNPRWHTMTKILSSDKLKKATRSE